MSVLGDYIHLRTSNYLKYGIAKNAFSNKEPSLLEAYAQQKRINNQRINALTYSMDGTLEELKRRIGKNFGPERKKIEPLLNKGEQLTVEEIQKKLLETVTGNPMISNKIKQLPSTGTQDIQKAIELKNKLIDNIRYFNQTSSRQTAKTISKRLDEFFQSLGFLIEDQDKHLISASEILSGKENVETAIKQIITAKIFTDVNINIQGEFGERLVAICDDMIYSKAKEATDDVLKEIQIGSQTSSFKLNEDFIHSKVANIYQKKYGQNLYQIHASQNKIDVQLNINGDFRQASVKTTHTIGNVKTAHLQDINLLTSLATTSGEFANHWMNLHCSMINIGGSSQQLLDSALTEHIKYEALARGNMLKKDALAANTFIMIDVNTGKVFAADIKNILKAHVPGVDFSLNPLIENISFANFNKEQDTWEERIANLIFAIKNTPISTSLKISAKNLTT